jgi:hypothetical protein
MIFYLPVPNRLIFQLLQLTNFLCISYDSAGGRCINSSVQSLQSPAATRRTALSGRIKSEELPVKQWQLGKGAKGTRRLPHRLHQILASLEAATWVIDLILVWTYTVQCRLPCYSIYSSRNNPCLFQELSSCPCPPAEKFCFSFFFWSSVYLSSFIAAGDPAC